MNIPVADLKPEELKNLVDENKLGFGKYFADRMFIMDYSKEAGWHDPRIQKYSPFALDPASCGMHYGQEIFEGMKAYRGEGGKILLFRPEDNAKRMNRSASRLCMPEIPVDDFVQAVTELVLAEKRWIPSSPGTSMYIRPTMFGTEAALGVHPSSEYIFYIIVGPVGAYYASGFGPISLYVEETLVRAAIGGTGEAKTGGNYAATLLAGAKAQSLGFAQILWLDAKEHKYAEEVGSMNIFFVFGDKLVTPNLGGSILPGITRNSTIALAKKMGYTVEERPISIDEIVAGCKDGSMTESFGTGTAAVISPVGSLHYRGTDYTVGKGDVGPVTKRLYDTLTSIQLGKLPDEFGWVKEIGRI